MPASSTQAIEAVLFAEVLKPLAGALGPLGDQFVSLVAERMFVRPTR